MFGLVRKSRFDRLLQDYNELLRHETQIITHFHNECEKAKKTLRFYNLVFQLDSQLLEDGEDIRLDELILNLKEQIDTALHNSIWEYVKCSD